MIIWVVLVAIWFNLIYGALIPITPELNREMAGVAFSAFALIKVFFVIPAGWVSDRIGHYRGLALAIVFQALAVGLILEFPEQVWAARAAEGLALAFGIMSALALCRLYSKNQDEFGKAVGLLMGVGSAGFLIGPFFGYLLPTGTALRGLLAVTIVLLIVHILLRGRHRAETRAALEVPGGTSAGFPMVLVAALGIAKALGVGIEPVLGWWSTQDIGLTKMVAGVTFVVAALGFMAGNLLSRPRLIVSGFAGLFLLEASLHGNPWMWWPALALIGLFSGTALSLLLRELGWSETKNIGVHNSKWMILSDLPMAVAPVLLWEVRSPAQWGLRFACLTVLVAAVVFVVLRRLKNR